MANGIHVDKPDPRIKLATIKTILRVDVDALEDALVRYLGDEGRSQDASALLSKIAADRPDAIRFPTRTCWIVRGGATSSFNPCWELIKSWREFDTLQWDVMEPRPSSRAD